VLHESLAGSSVCAKVVESDSGTRLATIHGTKHGGFHLAGLSCKAACLRLRIRAVATVGHVLRVIAIGNGNTVSSIQTGVRSTRANVELKLALQSHVATRAYAMFEIFRVAVFEMTVVDTILFQNTDVLDSFAANTMVFARERALRWILPDILELTNRSNVAGLAIAS